LAVSCSLGGYYVPAQQEVPKMPMQPLYEDGAAARWLNKKVLDSRELDYMEDASTWSFRGDGEMALADSPVKNGAHSLQNDSAHRLPDRYNEERHESIMLKNHEWNHVVWEIAPLDRDKVTQLDFAYSLPKMLPDLGDQTILYIDQLELQTVQPDHVEGWDVAPGKIAFSHAGYTTGSTKTAIASNLDLHEFSVIDQRAGKVVLTKPVQRQTTLLGNYAVLDFSEVQMPGEYAIRAGATTTRHFRSAKMHGVKVFGRPSILCTANGVERRSARKLYKRRDNLLIAL
jgi:hypothetical protein